MRVKIIFASIKCQHPRSIQIEIVSFLKRAIGERRSAKLINDGASPFDCVAVCFSRHQIRRFSALSTAERL